MTHHPFLGGVGLGLLTGAVVTMVLEPKKRDLKRSAQKAMRTVSDLADELGM